MKFSDRFHNAFRPDDVQLRNLFSSNLFDRSRVSVIKTCDSGCATYTYFYPIIALNNIKFNGFI